ncbi:hypothetical protein AOQ71_21240 [Bradyrhizobium manausense]|uniref:Uncharacterized protein n=1 Tax=Bradyrhizobium manausense TaxID=989370 RepID=A0A0R3DPB9_9BRAD|nr:hypothetical protein AOQ71_21240 [Bradyrhizobium manausense]
MFGGVVAGILAQVISGRLSRSVKISEFRQKWIDSLRDDVAAYIGATHKWVRKYEEINAIVAFEEKSKKEREEFLPLQNDALVILSRIKLRINPLKNRYKKEDDAFLRALDKLLDLGKLEPSETPTIEVGWRKGADDAIELARKILKREWEVTKQPGQWL